MIDTLSLAKLIIYIVLIQPAVYCFIKHGHNGVLGWFYVQVFCVLRIITSGLTVHPDTSSKIATILGGVGLSPLLLASVGLLHEA
jgi:prolipoprotein diacylglyceryltransferase